MIIDLLFSIANVLILFGLVGWAFKRYMLPSIKQSLQDYYNYRTGLFNKKDTLIEEQVAIVKATENQEKSCKELQEKIISWSEKVVQDREDAYKKKRHIFDLLQEKRKRQFSNYAQEVFIEKVTPQVKMILKQSLKEYFSNKTHNQAYNDTITRYIIKNRE